MKFQVYMYGDDYQAVDSPQDAVNVLTAWAEDNKLDHTEARRHSDLEVDSGDGFWTWYDEDGDDIWGCISKGKYDVQY